MDIEFSKIAQQLKIACTPEEYLDIISKPNHKLGFLPDLSPVYWDLMPRHKYSNCPFCGLNYTAQVDLYSLKHCPSYAEFGTRLSAYSGQDTETEPCSHCVAIHKFIHLNGNTPSELTYRTFMSAEVPMIQIHLLPSTIQSHVVMHALPICRIENNQFIPKYTLYVLTCFALNPKEVIAQYGASQAEKYDQDPEYYGALLFNIQDPIARDLAHWVNRGLLSWLDLDDSDKSLKNGPVEDFPYANIEGRLLGFYYENGIFKDELV